MVISGVTQIVLVKKKEIEESVKQSNMEKVFKENLDKSLVQVLKGLLKGKLPPAKKIRKTTKYWF